MIGNNYTGFRIVAVMVLFMLLLMTTFATVAATARDDGNANQDALAKAQYLLRQISTEKDALKAENDKLQEEITKRDAKIDKLNKKIKHANDSLDNSKELVGRYQETVAAQRDRMAEMRDKFQKLVDKYRELVAALKLVESERTGLESKVSEQLKVLESCSNKNQELYQVSVDLMRQYENKGVWDALMQKEPVTQLKRVEIETMLEETQNRIDDLKIFTSQTDSAR